MWSVRGLLYVARLVTVASTTLLLVSVLACGAAPRVCDDITLSSAAEQQLAQARDRLSFEPVRPCARAGVFTVSSVYVDVIPRDARETRISFVVASRGQEAFVWSQTRDMVPFTAIPAGTHHVTLNAGDTVARGFAGPSGDGTDTAYIRWRSVGVTYELAATLRPWLTESAVLDLAEGLMERGAEAP